MTIHAIYENGVFVPLDPVTLPERTKVIVTEEPLRKLPTPSAESLKAIYDILDQRFDDPDSPGNIAERHNEHQP